MIGNKIIELRQSNKMKQDELAKLLKVTRAALSHYENNSREPSLSIIKSLANIFNVSTDFLLEFNSKNSTLFSEKEKILIDHFRALPLRQQKEALNYINYLFTEKSKITPPPRKNCNLIFAYSFCMGNYNFKSKNSRVMPYCFYIGEK